MKKKWRGRLGSSGTSAAARVRRERAALSYRSSLNSCMSNWSGFGSVNCEPSASWPGRIGDICSIKSTRAARIRDRRTSLSAMISACSRFAGSAPLPQITVAIWSTSALSAGSRRIVAARPCRRALRRTRVLPAGVRGPVPRCELPRLAAILRSDAISRSLTVAARLQQASVCPSCLQPSWWPLAAAVRRGIQVARESCPAEVQQTQGAYRGLDNGSSQLRP